MIELVEGLCQFVAVVGDARRRIVLASLLHGSGIFAYLLYKFHLLFYRTVVTAESVRDDDACSLSLAEDGAYAGIGVLYERTCVTVEIDTLLRVEEHILAGVNLEDEVLQCAETHDACYLVLLLLAHVIKLAQFVARLACVLYHGSHEFVSIHHSSLAALHLSVRKFHHTVREVSQILAPLETELVEQY